MDDMVEKIENMNMNVNNEGEQEQNGGEKGEITSVPLVFLHERDLFGFPKPNNAYLKHEEMYLAVGDVIEPSHITGLQRVNGLWRIYVENLSDKVKLMMLSRGKSIPIIQTNPFRLDSERVTRIRIQNIPLSADDDILNHALVLKGLEIKSFIREKLRVNGRLTNCSTGDRLVTVKSLSLKEPLPRFMQFGIFKAKVIHKGQVNPALKCKKCLSIGHVIADCTNDWKCVECGLTGHKKGECDLQQANQSTSDSEPDTETEVEGNFADTGSLNREKLVTAKSDQETVTPPSQIQVNAKEPLKKAQEIDKYKRKKKKVKSKSQVESMMSSTEPQETLSKYFRQNPVSGTPNNSKTSSVTRSAQSPLDDPNITKKSCLTVK